MIEPDDLPPVDSLPPNISYVTRKPVTVNGIRTPGQDR